MLYDVAELHGDIGKLETITPALELKADALLIDERLGCQQASRSGLSITGLLGVLLAAKKKGLVSAIRPIVEALVSETNFRISNQLYQEVIAAARE